MKWVSLLKIYSFIFCLETLKCLDLFISERRNKEVCSQLEIQNCDGSSWEFPLKDVYSAFLALENFEEIKNTIVVLQISDSATEFDLSGSYSKNYFLSSLRDK